MKSEKNIKSVGTIPGGNPKERYTHVAILVIRMIVSPYGIMIDTFNSNKFELFLGTSKRQSI